MPKYTVSFAGLRVSIRYDTNEVYQFLSFLFDDLRGTPGDDNEILLYITEGENSGKYTLSSPDSAPCSGFLGVDFAAVLFDAVIFNLLNRNNNGIAFHAGAVAYKEKVILMPGRSGSGKSSMTACLLAHGCSYLTDELYFMPTKEEAPLLAFPRPLCIKPGAATAVSELIHEPDFNEIIKDKQGVLIPHRLLNPKFSTITHAPVLILFPRYQVDAPLRIDKLSHAQVCTMLMACNVNARNLADHGFQQSVRIARSTPAYQITYNSFQGIDGALQDLFDVLGWA